MYVFDLEENVTIKQYCEAAFVMSELAKICLMKS
mgnify:CR=1 FL=1